MQREKAKNTLYINPLKTPKWLLCQTANAQMKCAYNVTFHLGLHCLLRQNHIVREKIHFYFRNYNLGGEVRTPAHSPSRSAHNTWYISGTLNIAEDDRNTAS